jgi:hypothetical protein
VVLREVPGEVIVRRLHTGTTAEAGLLWHPLSTNSQTTVAGRGPGPNGVL